jgi:hypothetical protein
MEQLTSVLHAFGLPRETQRGLNPVRATDESGFLIGVCLIPSTYEKSIADIPGRVRVRMDPRREPAQEREADNEEDSRDCKESSTWQTRTGQTLRNRFLMSFAIGGSLRIRGASGIRASHTDPPRPLRKSIRSTAQSTAPMASPCYCSPGT